MINPLNKTIDLTLTEEELIILIRIFDNADADYELNLDEQQLFRKISEANNELQDKISYENHQNILIKKIEA